MSIVLGAKIIEKHFTLNNDLPGADNKLSLNPANMKKFIQEIRTVEKALENKLPRADDEVKKNLDIFLQELLSKKVKKSMKVM